MKHYLILIKQYGLDNITYTNSLLEGMFSAITHLHSNHYITGSNKPFSIINTDISDKNVFIDPSGHKLIVFDYDTAGLAGDIRENGVGDIRFVPPEQSGYNVELHPTLDVYALGGLIREIFIIPLRGNALEFSTTDKNLDYFNFYTDDEKQRSYNKYLERHAKPGHEKELIDVINKATDFSATKRYQTIKEFWEALQPLLLLPTQEIKHEI